MKPTPQKTPQTIHSKSWNLPNNKHKNINWKRKTNLFERDKKAKQSKKVQKHTHTHTPW